MNPCWFKNFIHILIRTPRLKVTRVVFAKHIYSKCTNGSGTRLTTIAMYQKRIDAFILQYKINCSYCDTYDWLFLFNKIANSDFGGFNNPWDVWQKHHIQDWKIPWSIYLVLFILKNTLYSSFKVYKSWKNRKCVIIYYIH